MGTLDGPIVDGGDGLAPSAMAKHQGRWAAHGGVNLGLLIGTQRRPKRGHEHPIAEAIDGQTREALGHPMKETVGRGLLEVKSFDQRSPPGNGVLHQASQ